MYSIPDTRKADYFKKLIPYTIGFQTITSDASDYAEFSLRTGKFVQKDKTMPSSLAETPVFNYKQGQYIYVKHDDHCHLGVVRNVKCPVNLVNVRCLKHHRDSWWKLEPQIHTVWYIETNILGHAERKPVMDRRTALFKLSK